LADIDPVEYLADVMTRLASGKMRRMDAADGCGGADAGGLEGVSGVGLRDGGGTATTKRDRSQDAVRRTDADRKSLDAAADPTAPQ
jgi:hypothetical protein